MKYTLIMILSLAGGQTAEQPASMVECDLVADALSKGELVQIDASDGLQYRVLSSQCRWKLEISPCDCEVTQ